MNITYIASARIPSERAYGYAIAKLCEEWGHAGHTVRLVIPSRKHGPQDDLFEYYQLERTFSVEKIPGSDFSGVYTSFVGFMLDSLSFMFSLRKLSFPPRSCIYTRDHLLSLFLPKNQLYLEIHTLPQRRSLFLRALSRARGIVAISAGVHDALLKLGVPATKILIAHDGVDLKLFEHAVAGRNVWRDFGIDPAKKIVLYTGHFYEWKGADTLAEAAALLPPEAHVVLMGGVDAELERFQSAYAGANISILPQQPKERIPVFLKSADVLVVPNSAKFEISRVYASPLKLFECMAAGVPILASDVPALREILDESTAALFKPDEPRDLARALCETLRHPDAAATRARAALALSREYTWASRAQAIAAFMVAQTGHEG